MAGKEERILITTRHKNEKLNMTFMDMYKEYTRKQAIERMAKALEEKSDQMAREYLNSDPYNNPLGAEDLAEAALNSLLEGK